MSSTNNTTHTENHACHVSRLLIIRRKIVDYEGIAIEIAKVVKEKNIAYGDSFVKSGEILNILYPDGVKPEQYGDMLAIVRVIDKMFRIATDKNAFGESPWKDINGYSLLAIYRDTDKQTKKCSGFARAIAESQMDLSLGPIQQ